MQHIGITVNRDKPLADTVVDRLCRCAAAHGLQLWSCDPDLPEVEGLQACTCDDLLDRADLMMALGGDGTLLHAARLLGERPIPLAGINLGSLGFLTSVSEDRLEALIEAFKKDRYRVNERTLIGCRATVNGQTSGPFLAVNDVVVGWGRSSRLVTLGLKVNGEPVMSSSCDGLIVATPTGSTGHSLSAGGPIVHPACPVLLVESICPHTLSNRPLVVPSDSALTLTVENSTKSLILSVDGQDRANLNTGDTVRVEAAATKLKLVTLEDYSYFAVLRQKLHWRGSNVDT